MTSPEDVLGENLTPIMGGYHVKDLGEHYCVDILRMLFNWRIVLTEKQPGMRPHTAGIAGAWCYFGHGTDANGNSRTMELAFIRVVGAALSWDGTGRPSGYDKEVFRAYGLPN